MTIIEQNTALSTMEQTELERCEQTIDYLRQAFTEAGAALATIREQRLYRAQYRTFEEYCQQRWGFSRVQAHRLIQAAEVQSHLLPIGNIVGLPENEAQARPLGKLDTPEEQQAAWQEAVERSGGKPPTAKIVEQVVQERAAQPAEPAEGAEEIAALPAEPAPAAAPAAPKPEPAPAPAAQLPPRLEIAPAAAPAENGKPSEVQVVMMQRIFERAAELANSELDVVPPYSIRPELVEEQARQLINSAAVKMAASMLSLSATEKTEC